MGNLAEFGQLLSGVGLLLLEVGVRWFVTVYNEINKKKE